MSTSPRANASRSRGVIPSSSNSPRSALLRSCSPASLSVESIFPAALAETFATYTNAFVNGDAVTWSFFVNGPPKTSYRCEPEFAMITCGMSARVLFTTREYWIASPKRETRELFDGKGALLGANECTAKHWRQVGLTGQGGSHAGQCQRRTQGQTSPRGRADPP